jgi:hypothetical protein
VAPTQEAAKHTQVALAARRVARRRGRKTEATVDGTKKEKSGSTKTSNSNLTQQLASTAPIEKRKL